MCLIWETHRKRHLPLLPHNLAFRLRVQVKRKYTFYQSHFLKRLAIYDCFYYTIAETKFKVASWAGTTFLDKNPKIFANYIYLLNFFFALKLKKSGFLTKVGYPRTQNPHKYWVCGHSVYGQKRFKKWAENPNFWPKLDIH